MSIHTSTKVAYVQKPRHETTWSGGFLSPSCQAVAHDLKKKGYRVEGFTVEELPPRNKVTPHTPVKGGAGCVKFLYERMFPGVIYPNIDIPTPLKKYARRKITTSTLGEVCHNPRLPPNTFVKPLIHAKAFHGRTLDEIRFCGLLWRIPETLPVAVQEYREFDDEIRYFVHPKGIRICPTDVIDLLDGEEPDATEVCLTKFAHKLVEEWKHKAPKAYVLDVGMSSKPNSTRRTPTLVEINSVLTCGNLENIRHPGDLVTTAWKSYARYGERGEF